MILKLFLCHNFALHVHFLIPQKQVCLGLLDTHGTILIYCIGMCWGIRLKIKWRNRTCVLLTKALIISTRRKCFRFSSPQKMLFLRHLTLTNILVEEEFVWKIGLTKYNPGPSCRASYSLSQTKFYHYSVVEPSK